jgi:hypothetical protein
MHGKNRLRDVVPQCSNITYGYGNSSADMESVFEWSSEVLGDVPVAGMHSLH